MSFTIPLIAIKFAFVFFSFLAIFCIIYLVLSTLVIRYENRVQRINTVEFLSSQVDILVIQNNTLVDENDELKQRVEAQQDTIRRLMAESLSFSEERRILNHRLKLLANEVRMDDMNRKTQVMQPETIEKIVKVQND